MSSQQNSNNSILERFEAAADENQRLMEELAEVNRQSAKRMKSVRRFGQSQAG